ADRRRPRPPGPRQDRAARLRAIPQARLTPTDQATRTSVELFDNTQLALAAALRGADARQSALSGNLANVDTPGYLRKDVDFQGALQAALGTGADPGNVNFAAQTDASAPVRADGNSVDIDRENAELS